MSQGIKVRINVLKIDKAKMYVGTKGTYLDIVIWERQQPDQYGNTHSVEQDMGKAHREAQLPKNYIGEGKFIGTAARPAQQQQGAPPQEKPLVGSDGMPF